MTALQNCSRCGNRTMECLRTHSHCWECGYSSEDNPGFLEWIGLEFRLPRGSHRHFKNDLAYERWMGLGSVR